MRKIQYVSKYIALSEEGLVPKLACPRDQGLLLCNQTMDDEIYLYCLECDYKKTAGLDLLDNIINAVNGVI